MSGWRDRAVPADTMDWRSRATPAPESDDARHDREAAATGLASDPGTTGGLNALDSLSVVGLPTVLGGLDALKGEDSASKPGNHSPKGILDRYYANKDFYSKGMDRLGAENPKSALLGQAAPLLIPGGAIAKGAKLSSVLKGGAAMGAGYGALRGPAHTLGGDVGGTVEDTAIGAGVGAGASLLGAGAGKVVEKAGDTGRGLYSRVLGEVRKRLASDTGTARNLKGQGAGAVENLFNAKQMEQAALINGGQLPGATGIDPAEVGFNLGNRKGNAVNAIDKVAELRAKNGSSLMEPRAVRTEKHLADIQGEANSGLKRIALSAAGGYAGYKGAEAIGVDPKIGAALGGMGGAFAARKAVSAAAMNPAILQKLMKLRPVGQAMARLGGGAMTNPKLIGSVVYALRNHPEVKALLDSQNGTENTGSVASE